MTTMKRLILAFSCLITVIEAPLQVAMAQPAYQSAPKSELDKAIDRCVLSVGAGAAVGAIFGALSRRRNGVAYGAGAGAVVGTVACAVMGKIQLDKDIVLQRQRDAIAAGQSQQASFQGQDGQVLMSTQVREAPRPLPTADNPTRVCRYAHTTVNVSGTGETTLPDQLYCRDDQGDWSVADESSLTRAAG
jgi:hypothetical protein